MHLYHPIFTLVVFMLASWSPATNAHSASPRLLKRVANPSTISLEILPRDRLSSSLPSLSKRHLPPDTLRYDDSFRLIISAFNETFHLHLRPNDHFIHPAARIHYFTTLPNGTEVLSHTEPLVRESVKAYLGEVVAPYHSSTRMREDTAGVVPHNHLADLGWARIMVHQDDDSGKDSPPIFEGAFSSNGITYHIVTQENYLRNRLPLDPYPAEPLFVGDASLVIWRETDEMTLEEEHFAKTGQRMAEKVVLPKSCGHDRLDYNHPAQNPMLQGTPSSSWFDHLLNPTPNDPFFRRDDAPTGNGGMGTNFINSIGSSAGCPTTQKIVYMGVAADCTYVSNYNGQENATKQILTNWNSASSLYKSTFNVSLGIVQLNVRSDVCPSVADSSVPWNVNCSDAALDARLSSFSQWRGTQVDDGIGLWHLMSGCPTGAEVGIAWLGTLCQQSSTGQSPTVVSGTAVSTAGRTEWQVVAHEVGHNFGAIHDCPAGCPQSPVCCPLNSTTCSADGRFIMSPVSQAGEMGFSPCSLGNICSVMKGVQSAQVNTSCLVDPDPTRQIISLNMCGNGIVEAGEDCDPGKGVNSTCCDVTTCKFQNGALCDPDSSPCCTAQCNFAPASQVCRPSRDPKCDIAEMCTGNSSSCPTDGMSPNGKSCGSNGLACASGQCTSVALQCQNVGASMGLEAACPDRSDQSCQISCQDPTNAAACIRLTSLLIDGSPCGFGGSCLAGKCQAAGILDTAKAWYTQNLQISIPVTVVAGLVALLLLWGIIRCVRRCSGGRNRRAIPAALTATPSMARMATHEKLPSYDLLGRDKTGANWNVAGSSTAFSRMPPALTHDRSGSSGQIHQEPRYNYSVNDRMNWVDDSTYNGPRRY